jgi:hypothetical protein
MYIRHAGGKPHADFWSRWSWGHVISASWSVFILSQCSFFMYSYACPHKEMLYNPANSTYYTYTYTTQNVRLGPKAFSFCTNHTPTVYMCIHIHTKFRLWFMYRPQQSVLCTTYGLDTHGITIWFLAGTKDFSLPQNFRAGAQYWSPTII